MFNLNGKKLYKPRSLIFCKDKTNHKERLIYNYLLYKLKKDEQIIKDEIKYLDKEDYDYKGHRFKNKFLVGDAGGFASGLTGEGIYFAIKSGEDVAKQILNKQYKQVNIEHILKTKQFEEEILDSLQVNKTITEIEFELLNLLLNSKWIDKEVLNNLT